MQGRFRGWLIGGGIAVLVLVVLAVAAWQDKGIDIPLVGNGGAISISDGTDCKTWVALPSSVQQSRALEDAKDSYLEGRLGEETTTSRGFVFGEGMLVNCGSLRTVGEAFARTGELVAAYGLQRAEQEFQLSIATGIAP
jgi:hypothetical protein